MLNEMAVIARCMGLSPSTVCREVKRNSKPNGEYVFLYADQKAQSRKHGLKNHSKPDELWWRMEHLLMDEDWSPGQIAGVLSKEGVYICKQTMYNHIHADTSGKLAQHTPHMLKIQFKNNKRPREKLDFSSPLHAFFSHFD